MKRRIPKVVIWVLCACVVFGFAAGTARADVYLNLLAVNGSEEPKEKEVKQLLPRELAREDILETGNLEVDYDVDAKAYYVHGMINLDAKETRTIRIRLRDIWRLEGQIEEIREQIDVSMQRLEGTEYYDNAVPLKNDLEDQLQKIETRYKNYSDDITRRIEEYRRSISRIKAIRRKVVMPAFWRSEMEDSSRDATIRMMVEIENPADEQARDVTQQVYLPAEVKPEHILDNQGFQMRFDNDQGTSFLEKKEFMEPGDTRRYEITIKDIWSIKQEELDDVTARSQEAFDVLKTTSYAENAQYLYKKINENVDIIEESQDQTKSVKQHIGAYRENLKTFDFAKQDLEALELLLAEFREDLELSKLKNILQKVRSLKGIAAVSEALFNRKPEAKTVWKTIHVVLIFVGFLTISSFVIWSMRSKDRDDLDEVEPMGEDEDKKT